MRGFEIITDLQAVTYERYHKDDLLCVQSLRLSISPAVTTRAYRAWGVFPRSVHSFA